MDEEISFFVFFQNFEVETIKKTAIPCGACVALKDQLECEQLASRENTSRPAGQYQTCAPPTPVPIALVGWHHSHPSSCHVGSTDWLVPPTTGGSGYSSSLKVYIERHTNPLLTITGRCTTLANGSHP
jgi:hypothetical protein